MSQLNIIPEYVLFDYLNKGLAFIRNDYEAQSDKTQSFLQRVLFGNAVERYDLITQAVEVFITNDEGSERFLEPHIMLNMAVAKVPAIYITLPSEQTDTVGNGLGTDEGYVDPLFQDSTYDGGGNLLTQGSFTKVFTRRFSTTIGIIIYTDNSNEAVLLYHVIKALLIALTPSLAIAGLEKIVIGGNDLTNYSQLADKNIFMKGLNISCQYESSVPNVFVQPMVHNITAKGTPING